MIHWLKKFNLKIMIICIQLALILSWNNIAYQPPELPHTFYGKVKIDEKPAPIGTVITAKVDDKIVGMVTTTNIGKYGNESAFNDPTNLIVQGEGLENKTIHFYINNISTGITYKFIPGGFTRLDLNVNITPTIIYYYPTGKNINTNTNIVVIFSEPMNTTSVENALLISPYIEGSFNWNETLEKITFIPKGNLNYDSVYEITILNTAKTLLGFTLAGNFTWSFTTISEKSSSSDENQIPVADADGPYIGNINEPINFDASNSYDPDENDTLQYRWDWTNDETYDTSWSSSPYANHSYPIKGTYTVKLEVRDTNGATDTDTTTVTIIEKIVKKSSNKTIETIKEQFNITLEKPFYANDTDGDEKVDEFVDPNGVLTPVHNTTINGNTTFLISADNDTIPELIWDAEADQITPVTHDVGNIVDTKVNMKKEEVVVTVEIEKTNWTYIEINDPYPDIPNITVKTSDNRTIPKERIWRENGKIYILDDPAVEYILIYKYTMILKPTFNPPPGSILNSSRPVINVTYLEPVFIINLTFNGSPMDFVTFDNMSFICKPKSNLTDGEYDLIITVRDLEGNMLTSKANYIIKYNQFKKTKGGISWSALTITLMVIFLAFIPLLILYLYTREKRRGKEKFEDAIPTFETEIYKGIESKKKISDIEKKTEELVLEDKIDKILDKKFKNRDKF